VPRERAEEGEACEVCGRYVLPGEPVHRFEDPDRGRRRRVVCPLCQRRALARGWVRPGAGAGLEREDAPAA
jgi:hypothetical protein